MNTAHDRSRSVPTCARPSPRAAAFTLIELLVVIAIIGVLVALLLPAVQSAREAARRLQCSSNLHQVGLALNGYHAALNTFPPGGWDWRPPLNNTKRQIAWSALILPYLEQKPLYDALNIDLAFDHAANTTGASTILSVYLCPSVDRPTDRVDGRGPCDYGGIYGQRITGPNNPPKGTMLYDRCISTAQIRDGTSQTLIVGEAGGFPDGQWINGRNLFDQAFAINKAPAFENDLASDHAAGGAHAVLADGSVRFLRDATPLSVLAALCTRAGGEVISADAF